MGTRTSSMPGSFYLPQGYHYFWYDEVASTNVQALMSIDAGGGANSWFCADRQTAGRGTRGKTWCSPAGNLYASLYIQIEASYEQLAQISLLAGLAAVNAMELLAENDLNTDDICLKWPNDIVLKERKVGGILVQSQLPGSSGARPSQQPELSQGAKSLQSQSGQGQNGLLDIIIGTGINIASSPALPASKSRPLFPPGQLNGQGWSCSRDELFVALVQSTRDWLTIWRGGQGFEQVRLAWLQRSCHIGRSMELQTGETVHKGRFATINMQGALVLEDENGKTNAFSSGHIVSIS